MMEPSEHREEKYAANPPSGTATVSVFYTGKNRVIKIAHSSSEMVLRITKHTMIYPNSAPFLEIIALHPAVRY
jgi:hypothetical protein